jgi:L-cysteine/cystine lyase
VPHDPSVVRSALPSLARETYLNTGAAGPLPRAAADAIALAARESAARGRKSPAAALAATARHDALRAAVGRVLGAPADEVALAASSTAAMNVAIWGIDWRRGDELVTTNLEHPGLSVPLAAAARRLGLRRRVLDLVDGTEDLEAAVAAVAGPRTRLVALSHVAWSTGARLDVEGAARAARAVGALTLVDGAQGAGAVPADPRRLGVDAYAVAGQKWLLGPEGLGALWVAPEAMARIDLTATGYGAGTEHTPRGEVVLHPGARRYEVSTIPEALVPGWLASLEWLERLGWDWVHARTAAAAAAARERLEALPGARVRTAPGAGLVAFTLDGVDPEAASAALAARGVIVRWVPHPRALRVSAGFFTDEGDLERLGAALAALR